MNSRYRAFVLLAGMVLSLRGAAGGGWNKYFTQGDQALLAQRYDQAIGNYRQGSLHGSSDEIQKTWDDLGYAFLQKRNAPEAIGYCRKALEHWPEDYDLHLCLAVAYYLDHDPHKALEELQNIENNVFFDTTWIARTAGLTVTNIWGDELTKEQLERLRWEKGVYLRAKSSRSTVVCLDAFDERNEAALHFFGGLVCEQLNEPERAETEFQSAVKAGARPQDVQFGRSHPPVEIPLHLHHRLKEHNNGLAWFLHEKFLGQLDRGQLIEGIETLREALDIEEQSFEINHNLALLYYDLADLDHAEMYCARALWVREGDAACHELMGNINFRQYAYGRAAYEFRRMIAFDPENPFAYYNLGSACSVLHDPAQAEILWRKAIDFDRDSLAPEPEKRTTDGKRGYTVVAKRTPVAYLAHKSLGNLYAEQSLVDKAIAEFEAAVRLRPDDASPYLSLGQLYQRKNDKDKAVFCLEKYLFLGGPKDVEARRLLDALKK